MAHVLRLIAQDAEKRGVRLVNSLPAALPPARMDPDRLGQALLNICLNALDAMPDGGTLTQGCTVEKQHLVLSVTDTGQGIAPENLNHIFDPYITSKGNGTGRGLATVHKIVEALEGEVYVQGHLYVTGRLEAPKIWVTGDLQIADGGSLICPEMWVGGNILREGESEAAEASMGMAEMKNVLVLREMHR